MSPVFKELRTNERLPEPEVRKAKELQRSQNEVKTKSRNKRTSVSVETYQRTSTIFWVISILVMLIIFGYAIYWGIINFIPQD